MSDKWYFPNTNLSHNRYLKNELLQLYKNDSQERPLIICIPDRDEDPNAVKNTVEKIGMTNYWAKKENLDWFKIDEILIGDQSKLEEDPDNPGKYKGVDPLITRGQLWTAKDVIMDNYENDMPSIYHIIINNDRFNEIFDRYNAGIEFSGGKWENMYLQALISRNYQTDNSCKSGKKPTLAYFDAENEQIGPKQVFSMAAPLVAKNSGIMFNKAFFDRYHMEVINKKEARRVLGGRINASVGRPLIQMLSNKGLIQEVGYALSGEVALNMAEYLNLMKKYGAEIQTLIQFNRKDVKGNKSKLPLKPSQFIETHLGINMDQPMGEGEPLDKIYERSEKMTNDIIIATFCEMNEIIKRNWNSPDHFIDSFSKYQDKHIESWLNSVRYPVITGGVEAGKLKEVTKKVIYEAAKDFMSGNASRSDFEDEFLPPLIDLEEKMGKGKFESMITELEKEKFEIKHRKER